MPWLPGILFGSLSIFVGLLALLLPETLNRPLPNTVEDIESWGKKPNVNSMTVSVHGEDDRGGGGGGGGGGGVAVATNDTAVTNDNYKHPEETLELTSNDVKT